jgi:predicted metal-dependent HD superfamily phosphohydrolase
VESENPAALETSVADPADLALLREQFGNPGALLKRWTALAGPGEEAGAQGRALIAAYAEPHRRYHTLRHLVHVLDVAELLGAEAAALRAVLFAAWFHDAVYDIDDGRGDAGAGTYPDSGVRADGDPALSNEERSALLAEEALARLGENPALAAEVARLVRLTAGHAVAPGDRNGAVLCDADLAVLGGGPEQYRAYAEAVREEYARIPDELFRPGRAAILRGLLALPSLFHTDSGHARFEQAARANLAAEIEALTRAL